MVNNIFLTGFSGASKTMLIKKAVQELQLKPGGFMTSRQSKAGGWVSFQLLAAGSCFNKQGSYREGIPGSCGQVFAFRRNRYQVWQVKNLTFNMYGVELLEQGLRESELLIMDELGRFELGASRFQQQVIKVLASPRPVLGVLKYERNRFVKRIWDDQRVEVIWVDQTNQNWAYRQVIELLLLAAKE